MLPRTCGEQGGCEPFIRAEYFEARPDCNFGMFIPYVRLRGSGVIGKAKYSKVKLL